MHRFLASRYDVFLFRKLLILTFNYFLVSHTVQFMFVLMKFLNRILVNMGLLTIESVAIIFQNPVFDRSLQDLALPFQHFRITQLTSSFPNSWYSRLVDPVYLSVRTFNVTSDVTFTIIPEILFEPNA